MRDIEKTSRAKPIRTCRGNNPYFPGPAVVATFRLADDSEALALRALDLARDAIGRAEIPAECVLLLPQDADGIRRLVVATQAHRETRAILEGTLDDLDAWRRGSPPSTEWTSLIEIVRGMAPSPEEREFDEAIRARGVPCRRRGTRAYVGLGRNLRVAASAEDRASILDALEKRTVRDFRVPIVSVTGTNGKTTVTRLITHLLASTGLRVGMTSTHGIEIAGERIEEGDRTGARAASRVLEDPGVDAAVLETSRGGILGSGLGYDGADAMVLTNIGLDHVGQNAIRGIEDIIRVKKVVVDAILPGGSWILNLDDEPSLRVRERQSREFLSQVRVQGFSLDSRKAEARFTTRDGWICERNGTDWIRLFPVAELSGAYGGAARFQVANALAAVAAVRALGIGRDPIARALASFRNETHNEGRNRLLRLPRGRVLADYGHNPAAIQAIGESLSALGENDPICVLGLPGDRSDALLRDSARTASRHFRRIFLREDFDRRGRAPGEVPELLRLELEREAPDAEVTVRLDGRDALLQALEEAAGERLVVLFYDEWERYERWLR